MHMRSETTQSELVTALISLNKDKKNCRKRTSGQIEYMENS